MSGTESISIEGTNLLSALDELDRMTRVARKGCRDALDESLTPMVAAYKSNLAALPHKLQRPAVMKDRKTGEYRPRVMRLAMTPRKRVWPFPDGTGFAGLVGPKSGTAPHAHLIESGTRIRYRKKIGGKYWLVEVKIQKTGTNFRNVPPPEARAAGFQAAYHPLQRAFDATVQASQRQFIAAYAAKMQQGMV